MVAPIFFNLTTSSQFIGFTELYFSIIFKYSVLFRLSIKFCTILRTSVSGLLFNSILTIVYNLCFNSLVVISKSYILIEGIDIEFKSDPKIINLAIEVG